MKLVSFRASLEPWPVPLTHGSHGTTWWIIPRIVSKWINPNYKWINPTPTEITGDMLPIDDPPGSISILIHLYYPSNHPIH